MAITQYSGLSVRQSGNVYEVYIPQGIKVLYQYCADSIGLGYLCRAIAWRYGIV